MNSELLDALNILEKEKNISKETLLEAIQQSLLQAYKNQYDRSDNVVVSIDPDTCDSYEEEYEEEVEVEYEYHILNVTLQNSFSI